MLRMLSRLIAAILIALMLGPAFSADAPSAQINPTVRDRVLPAAVQIAILVETTENGEQRSEYFPVGSGIIVAPNGLILTNWHVVNMAEHREQLDAWEAQAASDGGSLQFELDDTQVLILRTKGVGEPEPVFVAQLVAEPHSLDFAVLQITGDAAYGSPLDPTDLDLPFVELGDSETVLQGDSIHVFSYPVIGGGTLQYTLGVVSEFGYEQGVIGPVWITTDASISGGSSGGAAVDAVGRLIGVPTQASPLDCRPGDTNGDGEISADDVGCLPMGGSIGQLRPINPAKPMLTKVGWHRGRESVLRDGDNKR
jgi:serine protease Do